LKVKAAVLEGIGSKFQVTELDLAPPKAGEVLVKIAASGLCASDLNAIDGKRKLVPFPAVIGHEAAGVVVEVGPNVTSPMVGDHVILSIVPNCGTCLHCHSGRPNYCATAGDAMGVGGMFDGTSRLSRNGEKINQFLTVSSFAEYSVVPASGCVVISKDMPLDRAALISCAVLTGYGAVANTAKVEVGTRVSVFGCGGVGLNIIQGARLKGAKRIIAVDVTEEKLQLAKKLGATDLINGAKVDPVAAIKELTGGVDYAFEALGRQETIAQAWLTVDVGGALTLVGLLKNGAQLTIDAGPFVNEQSIKGCYFGSSVLQRDVPLLVQAYMSKKLLLDELITSRIGLEGLDESFQKLRSGEGARSVLVFE
jgi:S-(hydroxymethyl)glutathione dehydrogenase/alcohol dehydrogenase